MPGNFLHAEWLLLRSRPHHRACHKVSAQGKVLSPLDTVDVEAGHRISTNQTCLMGGVALGVLASYLEHPYEILLAFFVLHSGYDFDR